MFAWYYTTSSNTEQVLMSVYSSSANHRHFINVATQYSALYAQSYQEGAGTSTATATTAPSTNTWQNACAVFAASNDRRIYLNGGSKGTNTGSRTVSSLNSTSIGIIRGYATYAGFSGQIAHPAIWSVGLTDEEIAMLGAGISPLRIRPQSLAFYMPYLGRDSAEIDIIAARTATVTNATASANEPPLIWPRARRRAFRAPEPIALQIDAGALTVAGAGATFVANESVETSGQLQVTGSTATAETEAVAGSGAAEIAGQALTLAVTAPVAEPASGGGGRARPVRFWVNLYGRMVYVETPEEGVRLLREAQAEAQREAQREAEQVVARRSPAVRSLGRVKPVSLTPTVRTNLPDTDPVREARAEIKRIYDEAARVATALLERERAQWLQDQEDAQVLIALGDL